MLKIYSVSLGCPKNRVDTEQLLGALWEAPAPKTGKTAKALGPRPASLRVMQRPQNADLVLVNTCGFIEPAVRESIGVILELAAKLAALPPEKRPLLAVSGCLVGRYGPDGLKGDIPEVDLWLPTGDLPSWPARLSRALWEHARKREGRGAPGAGAGPDLSAVGPDFSAVRLEPGRRVLSTGPSYAWLKISEGCGQNCAFCTIPQIRGKVRSFDADYLAREATWLLERGVREIVLVAQDLTAWGRDLPGGRALPQLLDKLLPLPGLARLRLMYLYPAGMTEDFLRYLADGPANLLPYLDLPLQHAHPDILRRMGRPFAQSPGAVLERIRKHLPGAALRTSLITGFPGESEEQFETLLDFVREARFQNLGVFAYQAEDGTAAAAMPGQLPEAIKEERRGRIMEAQAEISREILEGCLGSELEILVDAPHPEWPGLFVGRAWFQAPEVDGVTYLSGENIRPGDLLKAEITESYDYDLAALV